MSASAALARPVVAVPSSYDELFRRDGPYIGKLVRRYLGPQASREDAEDVVQYIAGKLFSRDVLSMYDASHASGARWLTFLTRQVELYCRGQRQGIGLRARREPAKCDAPAGEGGTSWAELYGGAAWDDYPSLSDSELVIRLREYLESVPPRWNGPVSLVELFDLMVERVAAGEALTAPVAAAELGVSPSAAKSGLAVLRKVLRGKFAPSVVSVGGVEAVTRDELACAVKALEGSKSTAVKQPLARAGSRLAGMDYHKVAAEESMKYPELNLEPGTRKAHHGRVKAAVMHRLLRLLDELAPPDMIWASPPCPAPRIPVVLPKPGQKLLHVQPEPEPGPADRLEAEFWKLGITGAKVDELMDLAREAFGHDS